MTVAELIKKLSGFNPDAQIGVIAHNRIYTEFHLSWGGPEGVTKETSEEANLYVTKLNDEEDAYVLSFSESEPE